MEASGASEYGIEVRALCCDALRRGAPDAARDACSRSVAHVQKVAGYVRDPRLRALFLARPVVDRILVDGEATSAELGRGDIA